jgi:YesN/AraC family two-component response regulator
MKKILLEDVAGHVQLSPSYFCSVFKQEMKCNFNAYLNRIRIEMSKKLLMDNDIPLADVANLVGYEDQSYFTRVFRSHVGTSPGKYRERKGQIRIANSI